MFGAQDKMLGALIANTKNKSVSQMKTLTRTILPRVALYKALLGDGIPEADVYAYVQKYMPEKVAAKKHKSAARMEIVPGFYALYSKIFLRIMPRPTCRKARKATIKNPLMSKSPNAFGIRLASRTAVRSCAGCFVPWTT